MCPFHDAVNKFSNMAHGTHKTSTMASIQTNKLIVYCLQEILFSMGTRKEKKTSQRNETESFKILLRVCGTHNLFYFIYKNKHTPVYTYSNVYNLILLLDILRCGDKSIK